MKKKFTLSFLFFFFLSTNIIFSQDNRKAHFSILSKGKNIPEEITRAIESVQWESYRFIDKRRQIPIEGGEFILELYSANELLEKYGRQVDPRNKLFVDSGDAYLIQEAKGNIRIIKK